MLTRITAGDTLDHRTTAPDYPASSGWTMYCRLIRRDAGTPFTLTAITDPDNADGYAVQASATTTAAWPPGPYSWATWVTKAAEVYSVDSGTCTVVPNPRTVSSTTELRSAAQVALADAKTAYYAYTPTRRSYKIGDREMVFNSAEDIITHIKFLEAEVSAEQRALDKLRGRADSRKVYVRMAGA